MDNDALTKKDNERFATIYGLTKKTKDQRDYYQKLAEEANKDAPEFPILSKLSDECHVAYFDLLDVLKTL